jgi:transposase-like protein
LFKAKVALAALKGDKMRVEVSQPYEVHPNQVTEWKRQLQEGAAEWFESGAGRGKTLPEVDVKTLHAKIGQLALENDFLNGALAKAGLMTVVHRMRFTIAPCLPQNRQPRCTPGYPPRHALAL